MSKISNVKYTKEFKENIVNLYNLGKSLANYIVNRVLQNQQVEICYDFWMGQLLELEVPKTKKANSNIDYLNTAIS